MMKKHMLQYYSNDANGRVYRAADVVAASEVEASAIAMKHFLRQGASVNSESGFDIQAEGEETHRIAATTVRHWLRHDPTGQAVLNREDLQAVLDAITD
jgi:hypothetical protein